MGAKPSSNLIRHPFFRKNRTSSSLPHSGHLVRRWESMSVKHRNPLEYIVSISAAKTVL